VLAAKREDVATVPDIAAAEKTISQKLNSLGVVRSMKRNCTEAKNNIESVRKAVESMEGQILETPKTLRLQLRIAQ